MKRPFLFALLMISMTAVSTAQTGNKRIAERSKSTEGALISYERRSWEAVRRKDYKTFESFLADDFYDIFANGKGVTRSELLQMASRQRESRRHYLSVSKIGFVAQDGRGDG